MERKLYDVRMIMLYPLDESGLKTVIPKNAPNLPKQLRTEEEFAEKWRRPHTSESIEAVSHRSGDEWLEEGDAVEYIYRDGKYLLQPDEAHRIYDAIWRNMDRENNLINQRISWSIMLTAGFLTAQTFVLARVLEVLSSGHQNRLSGTAITLMIVAFVLCFALSILAAIFSRQTRLGVDAAQRQLMYLKRRYYRLRTSDGKSLFQDAMLLPRPFGNNIDHHSGNVVAQWFPKVMIGAWAIFAFIELGGAGGIYYHYFFKAQAVELTASLRTM